MAEGVWWVWGRKRRQTALPEGEKVFINHPAASEGPGNGEEPTVPGWGGSQPGQDDGLEPSPAFILSHAQVCALQKTPLAPHHIGTTIRTQPGCQFRRRMLLDPAAAGASPCPRGCRGVMVTEEGEGQRKMPFWGC